MKLYAAYGSNLNLHQMKERCPAAKLISAGILHGWQLCFRGGADIVQSKNSVVPVGVYETTAACERSLDIYEDYPTLYGKQIVSVQMSEALLDCFAYVMNPGFELGPPSGHYFDTILGGYDNWDMPYEPLIESLQNAFQENDKDISKTTHWSQHQFLSRLEADYRLSQLKKRTHTKNRI